MDCGSVSGGKKDCHSFTIKSSGTKLHFKVRKHDFKFLQILRKIHTKLVLLITYSLQYELFSMKISKTKVDLICLTLYYLMVTKRSHMLKPAAESCRFV